MKFVQKPSLSPQEISHDLLDKFVQSKHSDQQQLFENLSDKWLTTREAAEYLRISPKCLGNLTSNGKIPFYKFGRRNRYLLSELKKLLLAQPRGGFHGN